MEGYLSLEELTKKLEQMEQSQQEVQQEIAAMKRAIYYLKQKEAWSSV